MDVRENLNVRNVNNIVSEKIFFHDYNKEKYKNFLYPILAGVSEPDKNYFFQRAESDPCNPYMYVMEYIAKGKGYCGRTKCGKIHESTGLGEKTSDCRAFLWVS